MREIYFHLFSAAYGVKSIDLGEKVVKSGGGIIGCKLLKEVE